MNIRKTEKDGAILNFFLQIEHAGEVFMQLLSLGEVQSKLVVKVGKYTNTKRLFSKILLIILGGGGVKQILKRGKQVPHMSDEVPRYNNY